jgi:hypothetical protein
MTNKEVAGVTLNNTSLAVKLGLPLGNFFNEIGSTVSAWLAKGLINLKNLARNMIDGAKELGKAILRGDWNLFKSWLKEDPIAASSGVGAVLLIGGVVVGGVVSGIAALASAIGVGGCDASPLLAVLFWALPSVSEIKSGTLTLIRRTPPYLPKSILLLAGWPTWQERQLAGP